MGSRIQSQRVRAGNRLLFSEVEETTCILELYVDAYLGSDANQVGSSDAPFATVKRAMQRVPQTPGRILHAVRIIVSWPELIDVTFGPGGSLAIVGAEVPIVVSTGSYTVAAKQNLGTEAATRLYLQVEEQ
jgi:hypothetical protein